MSSFAQQAPALRRHRLASGVNEAHLALLVAETFDPTCTPGIKY